MLVQMVWGRHLICGFEQLLDGRLQCLSSKLWDLSQLILTFTQPLPVCLLSFDCCSLPNTAGAICYPSLPSQLFVQTYNFWFMLFPAAMLFCLWSSTQAVCWTWQSLRPLFEKFFLFAKFLPCRTTRDGCSCLYYLAFSPHLPCFRHYTFSTYGYHLYTAAAAVCIRVCLMFGG